MPPASAPAAASTAAVAAFTTSGGSTSSAAAGGSSQVTATVNPKPGGSGGGATSVGPALHSQFISRGNDGRDAVLSARMRRAVLDAGRATAAAGCGSICAGANGGSGAPAATAARRLPARRLGGSGAGGQLQLEGGVGAASGGIGTVGKMAAAATADKQRRREAVMRCGFCSDPKEMYRPLGDPIVDSKQLILNTLCVDRHSAASDRTGDDDNDDASVGDDDRSVDGYSDGGATGAAGRSRRRSGAGEEGKDEEESPAAAAARAKRRAAARASAASRHHNDGFVLIKGKLAASRRRLHAVKFGVPLLQAAADAADAPDAAATLSGGGVRLGVLEGGPASAPAVTAASRGFGTTAATWATRRRPSTVPVGASAGGTREGDVDWTNLRIDEDRRAYYSNLLEKHRAATAAAERRKSAVAPGGDDGARRGSQVPGGSHSGMSGARRERMSGLSPARMSGVAGSEGGASATALKRYTGRQLEDALGVPHRDGLKEMTERFFLTRDGMREQRQRLNQLLSEDLARLDRHRRTELVCKFRAFRDDGEDGGGRGGTDGSGGHPSKDGVATSATAAAAVRRRREDGISAMRRRAAAWRRAERARTVAAHPWYRELEEKVVSAGGGGVGGGGAGGGVVSIGGEHGATSGGGRASRAGTVDGSMAAAAAAATAVATAAAASTAVVAARGKVAKKRRAGKVSAAAAAAVTTAPAFGWGTVRDVEELLLDRIRRRIEDGDGRFTQSALIGLLRLVPREEFMREEVQRIMRFVRLREGIDEREYLEAVELAAHAIE
ncbi:hypothetical protein HK405_003305 [Cladochytrium tenue]|nr:hypothetical protein HK405_003305 [Cladochytrium tenue]